MTNRPDAVSALSITALLSQYAIDQREGQIILAHVLGVSRASLIAHPERRVDAARAKIAQNLLARRMAGEPVAYLLGTREFYGRDFVVSPATLIPRPETEFLVERALASITGHLLSANLTDAGVSKLINDHPSILDLGTGSGAIAISIALESPTTRVVAADISLAALQVATDNAQRLNASVEFIESDWYAKLTGRRFDLIVSNPPYVAGGDAHLSVGDLRFEPQLALTDESADGLRSIRAIIAGASAHLVPGGWLLFEHGYDQAVPCQALLLKAGFANLISIKDLAGIPRVTGGQIR